MKKPKLFVNIIKLRKENFFVHILSNLVIILVLAVFYMSFIVTPSTIATSAPIYKGNANEKKISLMINVYWGSEYIPDILKILESYDATCTFFVGGSWVDDNMNLLKEMAIRNEIGNHGYLHKDHKYLNKKQNKDEILLCEKLVEQVIGKKMNLFAPPSGSFGDITLEVCEELNYKVIMWSKDTIDWRDNDYNLVYSRATKELQNGDLVLMHPMQHTVKALPDILKYYKEQGYKAISVSENLDNILEQ